MSSRNLSYQFVVENTNPLTLRVQMVVPVIPYVQLSQDGQIGWGQLTSQEIMDNKIPIPSIGFENNADKPATVSVVIEHDNAQPEAYDVVIPPLIQIGGAVIIPLNMPMSRAVLTLKLGSYVYEHASTIVFKFEPPRKG